MKIGILRDNNFENSVKWEKACKKFAIDYFIVDLMRDDWLEIIRDNNPSFILSKPPGDNMQKKIIFDQKLFFLEKFGNIMVFPNFLETFIYENKAALLSFLRLNKLPHSKTYLSSDKNELVKLVDEFSYPIVAKTLIGAAGSGVVFIENKHHALDYINKAFSVGIKRRFGPNRYTGSPRKWFIKTIKSPSYFLNKMKVYKERNSDLQKNMVLFQDYVKHDYEWRCVKIGESYFAYKKMKIGKKASGAKEFEYTTPPLELLDFVYDICEKFGFNFMAIDVFISDGKILINEMQTLFGHKNSFLCMPYDKPGRYLRVGKEWIFEEGDFNTNESYDLRLKVAIELYEGSRKKA